MGPAHLLGTDRTERIVFRVRALPVAQPRPRVATINGNAKAYVPKKHPVHDFKAQCRMEGTKQRQGPFQTPLRVRLVFYLPRPQSHYRTGKHAGELKASAPNWHRKRPDFDNLAKAVVDGLTGILWKDDSQLCAVVIEKRYTDQPSVLIDVEEIR